MIRARALAAGLLAGLGLATGCLPRQTTTDTPRAQAAEDLGDPDAVTTVGQKTEVGNVEPIPVNGIGLVYNLPGTGSSPPPDGWRAALENTLRKNRGNTKALLDDPNHTTSLVLVSALIPPGARSGDKLDVAIALPPGSRTTSLKGGLLWATDLNNSEVAANARQALQDAGIPVGKVPQAEGSTVLAGHRLSVAEGPIVAGYDGRRGASGPDKKPGAKKDGDDPTPDEKEVADENPDGPKVGRIWGGAKCLLDRPYYLLLKDSTPQPRLAMVIAERMNAVFQAQGGSNKLADAKVRGRPLVVAMVPPAYRLNHGRFLLVARQIPLNPVDPDAPYRKALENDLLMPETTLVSAIKLEALGTDSRQPLRVGLQSESPWVRFASAEALAYLGYPDGARDLAEIAEKHPSLRTQSLTALASLDDAVCLDKLVELMQKPDAQLRYGAFVALRSADPNHEAVRGKRVNDSFWLHNVATDSPHPAVHVATTRRSEIVLYGSSWPLTGAFSIPLGHDFTVAAKADEPLVTVTRVTTKDGEAAAVPLKCRRDLHAVLTAFGELGGGYAEAAELIKRFQRSESLAAAVEFDPAPKGLTIHYLAQIARSDPSLDKADLEVERAGQADVKLASYDTPTAGEAVQAKPPAAEAPALNRDPGRLFGPRRPDAPAPAAADPAPARDAGLVLGPTAKK